MDGSRLHQTVDDLVRTTRTRRLAVANPARPFRIEPGLKVGEYVITQKVAAGGMGAIYAAQHPILGKRAAIKMVKAELSSDPDVLERFVREAQAVNLIQHPNIIDVFSIGSLPDGRPYFVMEWLDGENLADRIARPPPPSLTEAAAILLPVIDAIATAHAAGIVHRDLKPSNIFLAQRHGAMVVKVLDFGIAKLRGRPGEETRTGVVIGTPAYLAPEQSLSSRVDHRADVYALGVVAFELLTGHRPSDADNDLDTVPRGQPAQRSVAAYRPDVPAELDRVIARMMSEAADDRPPLDELASILKALGPGEPATTPLPVGELEERPRSRPWLIRLVSAGAVAGAAIAIVVMTSSRSDGVATTERRDAGAAMPEDAALDATRPETTAGEVQFEIRTDVDGARIEVDGRFLTEGARSTSIRVPPGDHDIVVSAPGHVTFRQHTRAGAGATVAIQAELPATATATTTPPRAGRAASAAPTAASVRALYRRTGAAVDQLVGRRDDVHARDLQTEYLSISSPFATDDPQQLREIEQRLVKLSGKLH